MLELLDMTATLMPDADLLPPSPDDGQIDFAEPATLPITSDDVPDEQDCSAFAPGPVRIPKKDRRSHKDNDDRCGAEPPFVFIPPHVSRLTDGGNPAILLMRVLYWFGTSKNGSPRLRPLNGIQDRCWIPGYAGIFYETGLNKDKALRAVRYLEKKGLIVVKREGAKYRWDDRGQYRQRLQIYLPESARLRVEQAAQELAGESACRGVRVRNIDVQVTRTGNEAIVLGAILPWFEPNTKGKCKLPINRQGHYWRANSYKQLAQETGLSEYQVKRAIRGLNNAGLIYLGYFVFKGNRTLHVRPNVEALQYAEAALGNPERFARNGTVRSESADQKADD
jgi:predicted transcriptional regulator